MKAKYALKALTVLAKSQDKQIQAKTIAAVANIPPKFLEAIMTELRTRSVVNSRRGVFGGFMLARNAKAITVGEIIRIMDGPLAPIRCASQTAYQRCEDCQYEDHCSLRGVMKDVRDAMSEVLDKRSLYDLAQYKRED